MTDADLLKSGRVMIALEPIKGQLGINKLYKMTCTLMDPKPGEEVWAIYWTHTGKIFDTLSKEEQEEILTKINHSK